MDERLERRRERRYAVTEPARILLEGGGICSVECRDISCAGVGFIASTTLEVGKECMLSLDLGGRRINAWANVIYSMQAERDRFRVGAEFLDMDEASKMIIADASYAASRPAVDGDR